MNNNVNYESIIDDVQLDFEEYIDADGLTVTQATSKIIEEEWRNLNTSDFIRYFYFIRVGIESLKRNQIADFLYEKLSNIDTVILEIENDEINFLKEGISIYKEMLLNSRYDIIETTFENKSRIEYILSINQEE
ncbi:hypothetical protein [Bacillus cereus group sp. BfR-BA-01380]|uniref:hypothetical protein n=1 Tax=Bacillus cereus group sp. BfR-BA-01380 TaxID=2920324 RepID=UPI001F59CBA8|nr:hypothetical protein [Bacillus cereus group sp. BfR-BA-01380]